MKSKRRYQKTVLVVLVFFIMAAGGIGIYYYRTRSQPKEAARQFMEAIIENRSYEEYLSPLWMEHPLPGFLRDQGIQDFRIEGTEGLEKDRYRIRISVPLPAGNIPFHLELTKSDARWIITDLPSVTEYLHGIPIEEKKKDSHQSIWQIALGAETMEIIVLPPVEVKAGQPIGFVCLDGILAVDRPLQPVPVTKILSLSNTLLEEEQLGLFPLQGNFPVFLHQDNAYNFHGYFALPLGLTDAILYRSEDQSTVLAVVKDPYPRYDQIRVLLNTSGYGSRFHTVIEITGQDGFEVNSFPNGLHYSFDPDETIVFHPNGLETEIYRNGEKLSSSLFRWHIRSKGETPLYVKSIIRSQSNPNTGTPYKGTLEVAAMDDQLVLVNEVELESYLLTVVPSEMPVSFGLEALKVQAVAARSYAAKAIESRGFRTYGAHLDDSTASQVYNNINEQAVASQAVRETNGMAAVYKGEIVDTRFFSSSAGYTANYHEVWSNMEQEFPSEEIPYLTAAPQYDGTFPDLYREENFRAFLDQKDLAGYDRFSPFFRWEVEMTGKQLEAVLLQNLPSLFQKQPRFVLTKTADGTYESREIPDTLGTLLNIEVLLRGKGGNMMELEITTTHGIFKIIKEYNIRIILQPVNYLDSQPMEIYCLDGSIKENFPLLPSAFAYIDYLRDSEGNISSLTIYGGGYGHGVGMSQYGAYGLTLMGRSWQDILQHYYPGSSLKDLYEPAE